MILLEETGRGWGEAGALRFQSLRPPPGFSLCFVLEVQDKSAWLLCLPPAFTVLAVMDLWSHEPHKLFLLNCLGLGVLLQAQKSS